MAKFPSSPEAGFAQPARLPQVSIGQGAGAGLAALGKGVSDVGDVLVQAQQERDAVKSTSAFSAYSDSIRQTFTDHRSRRGENTFGVRSAYQQFYDNAAKKAAAQLENDNQVLLFGKQSAALRNSHLNILQTLEATEQQTAKSNAIGSLKTTLEQTINENVFDDTSRNLLLKTYQDSFRAQFPGQNVEAAIDKDTKSILQDTLRMMIAQNPVKARAYNTEWKSQIGGANYAANRDRIKTALEFNESLFKQRKKELEEAALNKIHADLFDFEKNKDYKGRYEYIANIPDEFSKLKRDELKSLENDLKASTKKTKEPKWNDVEQSLIDRMNFPQPGSPSVTLEDIRKTGATTESRGKLKKIWDASRTATGTRTNAFKRLDVLWFGEKDIEGTKRIGKFIAAEKEAKKVGLYPWEWFREISDKQRRALRELQANQKDRLMEFFKDKPKATEQEVNAFFDTAIRPDLAKTITEIAVTKEPIGIEAEGSLRQQAIEKIREINKGRIKKGLPVAEETEENIQKVMKTIK